MTNIKKAWRLWVLLALIAIAIAGVITKTWALYVVALAGLYFFLRAVARSSKTDVLKGTAAGTTKTVTVKAHKVDATAKLYADAGWEVVSQTQVGRRRRSAAGVGPVGLAVVGATMIGNAKQGRVTITFRKP